MKMIMATSNTVVYHKEMGTKILLSMMAYSRKQATVGSDMSISVRGRILPGIRIFSR